LFFFVISSRPSRRSCARVSSRLLNAEAPDFVLVSREELLPLDHDPAVDHDRVNVASLKVMLK
jgi:hypothetical protein